jgi:hypothetical protein
MLINCDFMPLRDALRSKPVDWRIVLSRKINGLGGLMKSPRAKNGGFAGFSRARVGGIINDFRIAFAKTQL